MSHNETVERPTENTLSPGRLFVTAWVIATILVASAGWSAVLAEGAGGESGEPEEQSAQADDASAAEETAAPEEQPAHFERLNVVGSAAPRIPGAVTVLGPAELGKQRHSDVHRMLRQVPGVNIQEEEGFGLRPNIGMRGTGVERSQKITLLEDGVLVAPAPYSAPAAYYFPTAGRMESIEVRKGSASIKQGPQTNGGVLNLISSSIPTHLGGGVNLAVGGDATLRGQAKVGSSYDRFGWLVETYQLQTDGFKQLDGGGSTGFDLEDYMVKLRFNSAPGAEVFQALELKLGKTGQAGEETYVGLTQQDFDRTPYRRYAGSTEDHIDTDHDQVQLRYMIRPNRTFDLTATVYRNDFFRNWHKLEKVEGVSISDVFDEPASFDRELDILRGDADSDPDSLAVRNNRRDYYAQGIQTVLGLHAGADRSKHEIELGLRYHEDEEDRFQEEDLFRMVAGRMELTSVGAPGSQSNRVSSAQAWAMFAQDRISLGRWTVTPGVRVELIDFVRLDYGKNDPQRTGAESVRSDSDVNVVIPGVGVHYRLGRSSGLFGGIHKGFAPPGPGADDRTDPEESINYELGYRRGDGRLDLQVVGFYNDYDNLLGSDTVSAGGTGSGDQFNGGEATVHGLEAGVNYRLTPAGSAFEMPLTLSYTFTRAEFDSSFETDFAGWGPEVVAGDELPYLPRHQASLGLGWIRGRWSLFANTAYVDEMRTRPGQGAIPPEQATDAHFLVDFTANYGLSRGLSVYAQVRNLTDEAYVAARRPAGARPGMPRTLLVGIAWDF
jgi:Fe(3+) dicitrate transport protein